VAKANWGKKRTCRACAARFYDMNQPEPVCPKCGAVYVGLAVSGGMNRAELFAEEDAKRKAAALGEDVPEDSGEGDDDVFADIESAAAEPANAEPANAEPDEDDDMIEDASELGEDDDDVAEVMEGVIPDREAETDV